VRHLPKLLLLGVLGACGAPGSDSVFTRGNPNFPSVDTPKAKVVPAPAPVPRLVTKAYAGYYRKAGDDSQFQPCGTSQLLEIVAFPMARMLLRDRVRWTSIWDGAKLYAVFRGAIVDAPPGNDSSKAGPTKRFYLEEIDSMRNWQRGDCNGMRIPND
jgi:hypothetical protein